MKLILLSGIFLTLVSFTITDTDIVGVWESKGTTGNIFGLRLKKDGTFSSYINKKAFTTGQYTFDNDLGGWDEDPPISVGQAFYLNAAAPNNWVRVFSVN